MLEKFKLLPPDPILGLMDAYRQDSSADKIDLGVGVYKDEQGNTPVLAAVKQAEQQILETETSKAYIGPAGDSGFNDGIQQLLFGTDHSARQAERIRTVQAPGGCGALRVAAELIKRGNPQAVTWVSNPTWANHMPLLGDAGLQIKQYPYYDQQGRSIDFNAMVDTLKQVGPGDLVLLHGCCHNPCGADLSLEQWQVITDMALVQGFTPFIDIAYQGFGEGLEEDAYGVRLMAKKLPELIVASSCSKNFGLYRERVGALSIVAQNTAQAAAGFSQIVSVARGIYSMPPSHGAAIVSSILQDQALNALWLQALTKKRDRINSLRTQLVENLAAKNAPQDFAFIQQQHGMFSFLGITPEQVQQLRKRFHIYMVSSSRINVAGINQRNIDYFTDALIEVL